MILAAVGAPRSVVPGCCRGPVRYVGRISYGLYIWHWPIFIWLDHSRTGLYGYELFAVRVLVTFVVSVVSFHLIERPIRMGTFVSQWRAWLVVPAGVGAVLVAMVAATTGTSAVASTALPAAARRPGSSSTSATTSTTAPPCGSRPAGQGPPRRRLRGVDPGRGPGRANLQDKYDYQLTDKGIIGCGVVDGPQVELMGPVDTSPACGGPVAAGGPAERALGAPSGRRAISQHRPTWSCCWRGAGRWSTALYNGKWTNILHPAFAAYIKSQLEQAPQW